MQPFVLEDRIYLKRDLKAIKDLKCDNSFKYQKEGDGVKITGEIILNGLFCYDEENKEFDKKVPVDIFVPLNKIDQMKDLSLMVDDLSYSSNEHEVVFKIKCHLVGDQDDFEKFEPSQDQMFNELLVEQILDFPKITRKGHRKTFDKNFLDTIETMIASGDNQQVEVFSSLEDEDLKSYFANEFNEDDEIIELEESMIKYHDTEKEEDGSMKIPTTIEEDTKESLDEMMEQVPIINESEDKSDIANEEPSHEEKEMAPIEPKKNGDSEKKDRNRLSFKETYRSSYIFYRVKNGDTLESIAETFNLEPLEIKRLNPHKEIRSDELLELPRK